ncbi:formylglycine-generating enzyme family protein [Allorhodopirellula solitaria]|uniref:Serine/threonine-protein kinase pkn1 n=1 Tax=Allorhodopirellula solitaria TaxID=2527987 RepID=A0A5C5XTM7_9BACT|nr:SUMF1/EgtB/PvdO family nonheme iron enzyme [Allorhodopirellula solitaria]TWT66636.1 Serine/threonine-protein kinase pkn1 [Allorhodopirellula solitaria]
MRLNCPLLLSTCLGLAAFSLASPPAFGVQPAAESTAAVTAAPGIASEKPVDGPFVALEDGRFMVPYTERIPGTDISFEMIPVPGGDFTFGTAEDDAEYVEDEGPTVKLTAKPMWVAKTETRWDMYKEYMRMYGVFKDFEMEGIRPVDETNLVDSVTAPTELYDPSFTFEYGSRPSQPAVTMTQYAAQQFTKWLSRMTGTQYRLPTEAEWEHAARGGTETAYSWGDDADVIEDYAWYFDNSFDGPGDVATKKPNPFGLYDMHGNASEWTVNEYTEDGYQWMQDSDLTDATSATRWPKNPYPCVVRGGSWEMEPAELRSAARLASDDEEWKSEDPNFPRSPWWFTSDPSRGVGFRLFRSLEPMPVETIVKFWDTSVAETIMDVESRIDEGRGGYGYVDEGLGEAAKED